MPDRERFTLAASVFRSHVRAAVAAGFGVTCLRRISAILRVPALMALLAACAPALEQPRAPNEGAPTMTRTAVRPQRVTPVRVASGRVRSAPFTQGPTWEGQEHYAAHVAYARGEFERAARRYEVLADAEGRAEASAVLRFWAALSREQAGDHRGAAQHFERLARMAPESVLSLDGSVRALRLWLFLGEAESASRLASLALEGSAPLSTPQRVAALSALALAAFERGDVGAAQRHVNAGLRVARTSGMDQLDVIPRDLAQLFFAQAELRRASSEQLRFVPLPADFAERFESRARALLDAQGAYFEVMRARDAHWSAKAGFRIGELYQRLHEDVMSAPTPPGLEGNQAFEGALRLRYLVLLKKGLHLYERTVEMADRVGERSPWAERARAGAAEIARRIAEQEAFLAASHYTRDDLERVLQGIARRQVHAPESATEH